MGVKGMKNAMAYNSGQDVILSLSDSPQSLCSLHHTTLCHARAQPKIDNRVFRF